MNNTKLTSCPEPDVSGAEISLAQMLDARERRVARQNELLLTYPDPLVCFTLNIPGPIKTFPLAAQAFQEGCRRIETQLEKQGFPLSHCHTYEEATGYEAYYCVRADAYAVKALMCSLENQDSLGRIFDIDVIKQGGSKISRSDLNMPGRKCLLCGQPAPVCARSRAHSVDDMIAKIVSIITEYINQRTKESL